MWVYNCNFTSLAPHPVSIMYLVVILICFPTYFDIWIIKPYNGPALPAYYPLEYQLPFKVYHVASKTLKAVRYIYMCVCLCEIN